MHVLMDHHGEGYINAHPNYVHEKLSILDAGYDAFGYLDPENQHQVIKWLKEWKYDTPDRIKEYYLINQ